MKDVNIFVEFGATNVHPIAIALMASLVVLAFFPKRSAALFSVLFVCVFMHEHQRIVIGGLDFSMLRLIVIVAWIRVLVRGEYRGLRLGRLDRLVVLYLLSALFFYVLRVGPSAIAYRLGVFFDAFTAFFLIRSLVRTRNDVLVFWRQVAWFGLLLAPFMLYEFVTRHNLFGVLAYGGFQPVEIRDGSPRVQGPWSHPIMAGTFGSVIVPVFIAVLLARKNQRLLFGSACIAATIIVLTSGSSGPVVALVVGALGWGLWGFRRHTRRMLRVAIVAAVVIHFVREKPIWHLMTRLSHLTGGTGDHRYRLIDAFVWNFGEWALMGVNNTAHWGLGLNDTTNQYVVEGIGGGIVTLFLFLTMLAVAFVGLRQARKLLEGLSGPKSLPALLAWGSSVSLAAHCVSFISVSYFGQILQFFFFFLATLPALGRVGRPQRVTAPARPPAGRVSRERSHVATQSRV